jgi:hypothetical protein
MPPTQLSAVNPSPKRKRDPPHPPLLNTTLRAASTPPNGSPAPDSPRNAVADQLRGMSIAPIPMSSLSPDDVVHKKPKLELKRTDSGASILHFPDVEAGPSRRRLDDAQEAADMGSAREVSDTPQAAPPQQPRIMADLASFHGPTVFSSLNLRSAPYQTMPSGASAESKSNTSQPRSRAKSPSPPLSSLTWQDNEITGHLVDPSKEPDDDGTGLNGVGFKPTPAIAYARAQKRRQQLMEWRARESKDARAKRSERRRRGMGGRSRESTVERETIPRDTDVNRRTVRFAV